MKSFLILCLKLLSLALIVVSIAGYFSSAHQTLELISHLRILFAAAGLVLLLLSASLKNIMAIGLAAFALLINLAAIAPLYLPGQTLSQSENNTSISGEPHKVKLMQFNLWGGKNQKYFAVVQTIVKNNPDIIGFSEITPTWLIALKAGLINYPYMIADTTGGGIAIFSRLPLESKEIRYFSELKRPRAIAKIRLARGHFTLIFAHPFTPIRKWPLRNQEFAFYAKEAKEAASTGPVIVAGDLNCTPWSSDFSKLLTDGNLSDTEQGFGPQPSWNVQLKVPLFPIDHCLVSKNITTLKRYTGEDVGSDHLPVVVDLEMRIKN
ncbi:endonuclease/exonuclease/phosphatase family protein [soil metagenome]